MLILVSWKMLNFARNFWNYTLLYYKEKAWIK